MKSVASSLLGTIPSLAPLVAIMEPFCVSCAGFLCDVRDKRLQNYPRVVKEMSAPKIMRLRVDIFVAVSPQSPMALLGMICMKC